MLLWFFLFLNTQNSVNFSLSFQSKKLFKKTLKQLSLWEFAFNYIVLFFSFPFHTVKVLSHTPATAIVIYLSMQENFWKLLHGPFLGNMQRQEISLGTTSWQFKYNLANGHFISLYYCENKVDNCLDEKVTAKRVIRKCRFLFSLFFNCTWNVSDQITLYTHIWDVPHLGILFCLSSCVWLQLWEGSLQA